MLYFEGSLVSSRMSFNPRTLRMFIFFCLFLFCFVRYRGALVDTLFPHGENSEASLLRTRVCSSVALQKKSSDLKIDLNYMCRYVYLKC